MIYEMKRKILQDMSIRRNHHEQDRLLRLKALYEEFPELKALRQEEMHEQRLVTKSALSNLITSDEMDQALEEIEKRYRKKKELLFDQLNIQKEELEIQYDCAICKDTGITKEGDCICLRKELATRLFKDQNLFEEDLPSLEEIDLDFYQNQKQRLMMSDTLSSLKRFASDFKKYRGYSLIFNGPPGVGKTFFSNALAKSLIKEGYFVFYQSAPDLLTKDYKKKEALEPFILQADLLIIDDLGKEHLTESTLSDFFSMVDKRIKAKKSILISTNENPSDLKMKYGDAIFSRLTSVSALYDFLGPSLR